MTELEPCIECRRHITDAERACPFCGTVVAVAPSRALGRLSRAAVLASAALVGVACGKGKETASVEPKAVPADAAVVIAADAPADAPIDAPIDAAPPIDARPPVDAAVRPRPKPDAPVAKPNLRDRTRMPYGAPTARRRTV